MTAPPNHRPEPAAPLHDLTVVVVTFNSAHCLPALGRSLAGFPHVTVVDNASADGTLDAVRAHLPQAQVLANPRNLGFGAANNRALQQASTPYCLLLNPDCEVEAGQVLRLLAQAQAHPDAAMVVPQLMRGSGQPEINYRWPVTAWPSSGPGAIGPCCVGFACGAAWLLNMRVMQEIGFFDEGFFLYYEDDDLCQRIFERRKAIVLIPEVQLVHASRGSVRGASPWRAEYLRGYHHAQSKIRFTAKYQGAAQAQTLRRRVLWLALLSLPLRLLLPTPRHLARLAGRIGGLWSMPPGALAA
ncbi:MAG: glycosyltransferase family 2 protein [Burkholderiaceae bacterium]